MSGWGWLPWVLIVLLVIVALVLGVLIWRAGGLRRLWTDNRPGDTDPAPTADPDDLAPPARLRTAIAVALHELKLLVAGTRELGDVPWVMAIGADADEVAAMLPPPIKGRHAVSWSDEARVARIGTLDFRDGGVVVGFSDGLLDGERATHRLGALLRELEVIRPDRPIDAVVVVVPWEALAVDPADEAARKAIVARGRRLYEVLLQIQQRTGWRVPVHVIVSRCEQVPGFGPYAEAALDRSDNPVIGWPAPWSLDTAFEMLWIEEAFETLRKTLSTQQIHLLMGIECQHLAEQVMLFPGRLAAIRPALTILLTQMLESSAYHEGFMLRGVFLAGASSSTVTGADAAATKPEAETPLPMTTPAALSSGETQAPPIAPGEQRLARALFARKIFPETRLAQPAYGERTRRHTMIRRAQLALGAAVLLSLAGYASILHRHDDELPRVAQLLTGIEASQNRAQEIRRATQDPVTGRCRVDAALPRDTASTLDFAQQKQVSIALLDRMSDLDVNRVQTLLAPTSYLTGTDQRVEQAIRVSFRDVVFHAIAQSMATGPGIRLLIDRDATGTDPDTLWKQTVTNATEYDTNYTRLQRLANSDRADGQSVTDFAAVIRYALGEALPPQFTRNYRLYSAGLSGYAVPCIGSGPVQDAIGRVIEENYLAAVDRAYVRNPVRLTTDTIATRFGEGGDLSEASLRGLVDDLDTIDAELAVPGRYAWVAATRPDELSLPQTGRLQMLRMLPPGLVDRLRAQGEPFALDAAARLRQADLFGAPILSVGAAAAPAAMSDATAAVPTQAATNPPAATDPRLSQAMLDTQAYLRLLFAQTFMADATGGVATDDIRYAGPGWDFQSLHDAGVRVKAFVGFVDAGSGLMPPELREIAHQIARRHLAEVLMRQIAQATEPQSAIPTEQFVRELPVLTALRDAIRGVGLEDVSAQFDGRIAQRAVDQFADVDEKLRNGGFYAVDPDAIARWTGSGSLAAAAFGVADPQDLAALLAEWRSALATIARGRAAPLVGYLTDPATVPTLEPEPRLAFWQSILGTLTAYDAKTPNSLSRLETFITVGIDQASRDCGMLASRRIVANDYFARAQATIAAQVARRCHSVGVADLRSRFARVRAAFAELLEGRFPFSGDVDAPGADPDDVRRFFAEHGGELQPLKVAIDAADGPGTGAATALDRLVQMRAALAPMLTDGGGPLAYHVDVRFFTDDRVASGQGQVIEAAIGTPASRAATPVGDAAFAWTEGQPVFASFRWAANAPNLPGRPDATPRTRCAPPADGATVRFGENGDWALLRLIRRRAPGDAAASTTTGIPVAFVVPLCPNHNRAAGGDPDEKSGRVFLRLSLGAAKAEGPTARVLLPSFPAAIPARATGR